MSLLSKIKNEPSLSFKNIDKSKVGKPTITSKNRFICDATNLRKESQLKTLNIDKLSSYFISDEELRKMAVCQVKKEGKSGINTVNDPRLGVIDKNVTCDTCNKTYMQCTGHLGYIDLAVHFLNPLAMKPAIYVAQSVCNDCGKLLISKECIIKNNVHNARDITKLKKIAELCTKVTCTNNKGSRECKPNPVYYPNKTKNEFNVFISYGNSQEMVFMDIDKLYNIFNSISKEDLELLGFTGKSHPKNFIMKSLPIIPINARPPVYQDDTIKLDYLTIAYMEILKINNKIEAVKNQTLNGAGLNERDKNIKMLYFKISHLINNSDKKYTQAQNEPILAIKQRLIGKEGYIRKFVMGKRVNNCLRTVAGPGSVPFTYLGFPERGQKNLTISEKVTVYNYQRVLKLRDSGCIKNLVHGPKTIKEGCTIQLDNKKYVPEIGDTIERFLEDGDVAIQNRQPTLHKNGFMGVRLIFHKDLNLKSHSSMTTPLNMDFDGDEINGHIIQTPMAQAEALHVANAANCIMNSQSNKPTMGLVFNCPSSAYMLSNYNKLITPRDWENMKKSVFKFTDLKRLESLEARLKKHGLKMYSKNAIFSSVLPENFYYCKKGIKIIDGIYISGELKAAHVGVSTNSIIHVMNKTHSKNDVVRFFTEGQLLFDWFIVFHGLSIGYKSCILENSTEIKKLINIEKENAIFQIEALGDPLSYKTPEEKQFYEQSVKTILDNINSIGVQLVQDLPKTNAFKIMCDSGAKGNPTNMIQMLAMIGQQKINNQRIPLKMNGKRRYNSWYSVDDPDLEARGFIPETFMEGMNPGGNYFHMECSRHGLVNTAIHTASIGSAHHYLNKVLEDVHVNYDGCVCDKKTVFQFVALDGFDAGQLIPVKCDRLGQINSFIDLETVIGKINNKYS